MNAPQPYRDERPWGNEVWLTRDLKVAPSMVKVITVKPGEALSLQYHKNREEFWFVLSGNGSAHVDDTVVPLTKGAACFVHKEQKHRIIGGTEALVFIELAFGDFNEADIVRLEDKYGRTS